VEDGAIVVVARGKCRKVLTGLRIVSH
jgi:hypothetical protein